MTAARRDSLWDRFRKLLVQASAFDRWVSISDIKHEARRLVDTGRLPTSAPIFKLVFAANQARLRQMLWVPIIDKRILVRRTTHCSGYTTIQYRLPHTRKPKKETDDG